MPIKSNLKTNLHAVQVICYLSYNKISETYMEVFKIFWTQQRSHVIYFVLYACLLCGE